MNEEALKILDKIKENVNECCGMTMEPDIVLDLIEELKNILKQNEDEKIN
jgi:hypothetical protein